MFSEEEQRTISYWDIVYAWDRLLFQKFCYIAESEGRSTNKEIEQYFKKRVAEYKKENGKIEIEK